MSDDVSRTDRDGVVRIAQIIAGALMAGLFFFLMITTFVRVGGKDGLFAKEPWNVLPPGGLISLIALVFAVSIAAMSFVVPQANVATMRRAMAKQTTERVEGRFDQIYLTTMIVGMAMLESGGFFNMVAFMLEGHIPNLLAALVLVALIAARFPSRARFDNFADEQEALLLEERQSA